MSNPPQFCSSRTAGAIAEALFGERGKLCTNLVLILQAGDVAKVMAEFPITEADGQAVTDALGTERWQLIDMEPAQD